MADATTTFDEHKRITSAPLLDELLERGSHGVAWDGLDEHGNALGSGTYFYHLTTGDQRLARKLVLLK